MATESNKSTKPGDAKFKPKVLAVPNTAGYPNKGGGTPKKTRGNGAATKGTKSYGPMA